MLSSLLALQLLAAPQPPAPPAPPPPPAWYGWQTLIADGVAAIVTGSGTSVRVTTNTGPPGNGIIGVGIALYLLGGPTVHAVNGNWWHVLPSLAFRIGGVLAGLTMGGIVSIFTHGLFTGTVSWVEPTVGCFVGGIAGSAVDAGLLAFQSPPEPASATAPQVRLAPFTGSVRGAPVAGVAGAF